MIEHLYGAHYTIYPFRVSASNVGHTGSTRDRLYLVLAHKVHTRRVVNMGRMLRRVFSMIKANIVTFPADYLVASPEEIILDATDCARIRKKKLTAT